MLRLSLPLSWKKSSRWYSLHLFEGRRDFYHMSTKFSRCRRQQLTKTSDSCRFVQVITRDEDDDTKQIRLPRCYSMTSLKASICLIDSSDLHWWFGLRLMITLNFPESGIFLSNLRYSTVASWNAGLTPTIQGKQPFFSLWIRLASSKEQFLLCLYRSTELRKFRFFPNVLSTWVTRINHPLSHRTTSDSSLSWRIIRANGSALSFNMSEHGWCNDQRQKQGKKH